MVWILRGNPFYQQRALDVRTVPLEVARHEIRAEGADASRILDDNDALTPPLEGMDLESYTRWYVPGKYLGPTP